MHLAIDPLLLELWQVAEVVGLRVLYHHECARLHHLAAQDELGQLGQLRQVVGWVGKDQVKLASARAYELEYIAFHRHQVLVFELLLHLADEVVLGRRLLHTGDAGASAGEEFEADCACPREQVESYQAVEVHKIVKHIEEVLARHVGGGASGDVGGHVKTAAAIFSTDYSHRRRGVMV